MPATSPVRKLLSRLALVVVGVALGLLALEGLLQLAAPLMRPALRPIAASDASGGAVRVLCVGDSHTFGIWVDPAETYPARLQARLSGAVRPFVILNAGVPGINSTQVREAMPTMLDAFQPSVVLLMVGVADFWNLTSLAAEEYHGWRYYLWGGGWLDKSRVVKLARLIRFNLLYGREPLPPSAPEVEHTAYNWKLRGGGKEVDIDIDMHLGDGIRDVVVFRRLLRRDLSPIATQLEARGVSLVLMTYPTDAALYGAVNEVYRQFAESAHLPLIDLAAQLAEHSQAPLLETSFFPDFHPRPPGYEAVAGVIAGRLGEWFPPDP